MDRTKLLIERISKELKEEGYTLKDIYEKSLDGYGDFKSFFDLLIDLKLEGKKDLSQEALWTNLKKQINYRNSMIAKAADDYRKLENKYRNLLMDYENLIKEK